MSEAQGVLVRLKGRLLMHRQAALRQLLISHQRTWVELALVSFCLRGTPLQYAGINTPPHPDMQQEVERQQQKLDGPLEDTGGDPCHAGNCDV